MTRAAPPVVLAAVVLAAAAGAAAAWAAGAGRPAPRLDPADTQTIEDVVHDYILSHPDVMAQAVLAAGEFRRQREDERIAGVIRRHDDDLHGASAFSFGNPDGDVTLVEFFDYQCGYCKRTFPDLMAAVREDGGVRLVFKEFPVLGPASEHAARAASAAARQGKYLEFHTALMQWRGRLEEPVVYAIAQEAGLDIVQLQEDMKDPAIQEDIDGTLSLARQLRISGTPSFIINGRVIPGALDKDRLKKLIRDSRPAADG